MGATITKGSRGTLTRKGHLSGDKMSETKKTGYKAVRKTARRGHLTEIKKRQSTTRTPAYANKRYHPK